MFYPFDVCLSLLYNFQVKGQSRLTEFGHRRFKSLVAPAPAVAAAGSAGWSAENEEIIIINVLIVLKKIMS